MIIGFYSVFGGVSIVYTFCSYLGGYDRFYWVAVVVVSCVYTAGIASGLVAVALSCVMAAEMQSIIRHIFKIANISDIINIGGVSFLLIYHFHIQMTFKCEINEYISSY